MFLQVSVILFTGGCLVRGVPGPGGCLVWGCLVSEGCEWSRRGECLVLAGMPGPGEGGAWWRPPWTAYCWGRYAPYWNAFLLKKYFGTTLCTQQYVFWVPPDQLCLSYRLHLSVIGQVVIQIILIWRITICQIRENCKWRNYQSTDCTQTQKEMQIEALDTHVFWRLILNSEGRKLL